MNYDDLSQQTMSAFKEGGWDAAISYISNIVDENQNNHEAYLVRSEMYTEMGDFRKALDDAEKAVKINPKEAAVYNNRGCIFIKSGDDINKAFNDFNKVIELDASYISAYINRANVYLKMKEPQKAISDCTKAIEISPDGNAEPYYNRGLAYMNIGETTKALDDYNRVIEIDPENAEAYAKRGLINSQSGNTQEAISDYEEFLRLDPGNKNAKLVRDDLERLKSGKTISFSESGEAVKEKNDIKKLLVFSAVGFFLGIIIGASGGNVLIGMWFGIGVGCSAAYLLEDPALFMRVLRKDGLIEAIKTTVIGGGVLAVIFMIAGPIGLLVRIVKKMWWDKA